LPLALDLQHAFEAKVAIVPREQVVFYEPLLPQAAMMLEVFDSELNHQYCVQFSLLSTEKVWPMEGGFTWVSSGNVNVLPGAV